MDTLERCIAVYANLLVQMKELDELRERLGELRERVEKAKKFCPVTPAQLMQKPVSFH